MYIWSKDISLQQGCPLFQDFDLTLDLAFPDRLRDFRLGGFSCHDSGLLALAP
jgi:hypothetical protein